MSSQTNKQPSRPRRTVTYARVFRLATTYLKHDVQEQDLFQSALIYTCHAIREACEELGVIDTKPILIFYHNVLGPVLGVDVYDIGDVTIPIKKLSYPWYLATSNNQLIRYTHLCLAAEVAGNRRIKL